MKINKNKIILSGFLLGLLFFVAFKNTETKSVFAPNTNTSKDSFQILVNDYTRFKEIWGLKETKKKEYQNALTKLQGYTSKINGSKTVVFRNIKYFIFIANLDSDEIRMHLYDAQNKNLSSLGAVKKQLEEKKIKPLMITNAGMFTKDYEPEGYYIEYPTRTFFALDTASNIPNANFYLMPNGVFYLDDENIPHIYSTERFKQLKKEDINQVRQATQSGPMLVINGNIHPAFIEGSKNKRLRSGVGLIKGNNKKVVFAITDGECNFYDFAIFFRDVFNSDNALFLDGAISQMYLHDLKPKELGGSFGPMISVSKKDRK